MKHTRHLSHSWIDLSASISRTISNALSAYLIVFLTLAIAGSLQAADPPNITITSPSSPVVVSTGQSKQFNVEATAAAGLKDIEWFVGTSSERYTSYTATWDYYQAESFSYSFSSPGTYFVSAYVHDRNSPQQQDGVMWEVSVVQEGQPPARPSREFFDDFNYANPDDPSFVGFGWHVRTGLGGPGVSGATWSDERVAFVEDVANPGGRLMKLTAATSGNATSTEHVEVSTDQRFFEGTYAVRARLTDSAATGTSNDGIVQAPLFTINSLQFDNDPDYSELDFEYLPNDVWSGGTRSGPTMYCTSWETYQNSPWLADNTYTPLEGSYSGWHTLVFQVADGQIHYYIDGAIVASHGGDYYPESLMSIMTQLWFIQGELSPETGYREWEMEIDWVYHGEGVGFTPIQVESIVDEIRSSSIARLDTFVEPNLDISVSANPLAGGNVTGGGTFNYGTSRTVTASENTGYDFVRWTEGSSQVSTNPSYTFTLTSNRNLVAEFVKETRNISVSAIPSAGGSVTGGGTFDYGTSRTVTASASTGYDFVRWTEGGSQVSINPSYIFTLNSDHQLVAEFNPQEEFKVLSFNGLFTDGFTIEWTAVLGYSYQVKFSDTLQHNDWHNVGPSHQPAIGQTSLSYTDHPASGSTWRFYKVERTPIE